MIDGIIPPRRPERDTPSNPSTGPRSETPQFNQQEPAFRPPELVASEEGFVQKLHLPESSAPMRSPDKKPGKLSVFFARFSKKQRVAFIIVAAIVVLGGGGAAAYMFTQKEAPQPAPVAKEEEKPVEQPPKPTTLPSPLTGVQVSPELAQMPVTGVMIENSPDARPQSGLNQAGIVYEAVAEGGITRFLALFQESQPDYIGPVRSVRPYYIEWVQGYDAAIAHVGGSPEALDMIRSGGLKDLDQFHNAGAYHRVSSRYAPHNMYSSLPKLVEAGKRKGYNTSNFTGFSRKEDKASATPNATSINVTISSYLYNPSFAYDATTNSYKRSMAGKPHVDERSKEQISPKVVVVMVVPYSIHADRVHSVYQTTGSGKAFIFQDGTVTEGIWEKSGSKSGVRLGDATGAPLPINVGQTWISVVGTAGSVSYK